MNQLGESYKRKPGFSRQSRLSDMFKFENFTDGEDTDSKINNSHTQNSHSSIIQKKKGRNRQDSRFKSRDFLLKKGKKSEGRISYQRGSKEEYRFGPKRTPKSYKSSPAIRHRRPLNQPFSPFSSVISKKNNKAEYLKNIFQHSKRVHTIANSSRNKVVLPKRYAKTDQVKQVNLN